METKYIKEIQVNNNSVTAINNCNQIVSWLSSVITEIEETSGTVTISKTDGTQINIPIEQGVTSSELNSKLEKYYTQLEVNDMIEDIKLSLDKFITDERFRMILDINSGSKSSSCGGDCDGGCGGCCGFNTCCLNFLTAFVDNRECCGGITLIDNMGNQINILEELKVHDITDNGDGTYHITKCDEEWDTTRTQVIDNGDGTYTFINWDGSEFTLELEALPTLSKWLIYNGVDKEPWYPEADVANAVLVPVPGYTFLEFQNIDVAWLDVNSEGTEPFVQNTQSNQFPHNGNLSNAGTPYDYLNVVDSCSSFGYTDTVYPYNYNMLGNYELEGKSTTSVIATDIALGYVTVAMGVSMTDLTTRASQINDMPAKQKALLLGTADSITNTVYDIWKKSHSKNYRHHEEATGLLTEYLNDGVAEVKRTGNTAMEDFIARVGGDYVE